jgi:RimJ/RimL family protein N-acetyltransferase
MGFVTCALSLASTWAITESGFVRAEAWVQPENVASQRALIAAGFECEGRLRSFLQIGGHRYDALVYSRIRT